MYFFAIMEIQFTSFHEALFCNVCGTYVILLLLYKYLCRIYFFVFCNYVYIFKLLVSELRAEIYCGVIR